MILTRQALAVLLHPEKDARLPASRTKSRQILGTSTCHEQSSPALNNIPYSMPIKNQSRAAPTPSTAIMTRPRATMTRSGSLCTHFLPASYTHRPGHLPYLHSSRLLFTPTTASLQPRREHLPAHGPGARTAGGKHQHCTSGRVNTSGHRAPQPLTRNASLACPPHKRITVVRAEKRQRPDSSRLPHDRTNDSRLRGASSVCISSNDSSFPATYSHVRP